MKKIFCISLILASALAFSSCVKEEEDIFDKSAAERLNEASDLYSSRLMASPNGWAMQLYPTTQNEYPYGNGYLLLCRFNADHSVNVSMDNVFSDNKYAEDTSLWEVLTDNGPVLSFNSYNKCLHAFSDPYDLPFTGDKDNTINETGTGAEGDYEFIIVDAPEDASYMMLKGKKRGTYNLLTPIEVGVQYADYLADVKAFQNKMFAADAPTFNVVHYGDKLYKMTGANDGIPNIYPYDGDEIIDESFNAFLITKRGDNYYFRFRDKVDDKVQEFMYKPDQDIFESVEDPSYFIEGNNPLLFFSGTLGNPSFKWVFNSQSDKVAAIINDLAAQIEATSTKNAKYALEQVLINTLAGITVLQVSYSSKVAKQGTLHKQFYYEFKGSANNDVLNFSYVGPAGKNAEEVNASTNAVSTFPALNQLINFMGQSMRVEAADTRFNLNGIKLVSTADAESWVNLKAN